MSCNLLFTPQGLQLSTTSTNVTYAWLTGFVLAPGMSLLDVQLLMRDLAGTFGAKPVYQTASVREDNPNAPVVFSAGSYASAAGFEPYKETLTLTSDLLIRVGVAYKNMSGAALGSAWVQGVVAARQCGAALGSTTVLLNPGMVSGTDVNYFPIGAFRPLVGLSKVMGAFVVNDNESTHLEYQLVMRTARDPRAPNAWQLCEAGWSNPAAGNSDRNTSLLTPPAGANVATNMYFQLGIAARKKSGAAGNPRASLTATTAATYA